MSDSRVEEMKVKIREIQRLQREVTSWLIDNPCLGDIPQKEEMYRLAIDYYKTKREKCKKHGSASYNGTKSINLKALIDCYQQEEGSAKQEYARKIARYLFDEATNYWLRLIPDEIRETAIQIIIDYLEQQMSS